MGDNYLKLAGVSLQHIRIVCFVSRDHYHKISNVKTATVATGLAGVIGNKGCSAIAFSFFDAKFCFIGSHLAARIDRKRLEARNQNYRDILKGLASGFSTNGTKAEIHLLHSKRRFLSFPCHFSQDNHSDHLFITLLTMNDPQFIYRKCIPRAEKRL